MIPNGGVRTAHEQGVEPGGTAFSVLIGASPERTPTSIGGISDDRIPPPALLP
jgi:hypothetical protein